VGAAADRDRHRVRPPGGLLRRRRGVGAQPALRSLVPLRARAGQRREKWNRLLRFRALPRRSFQIAAYRRISARISDHGRLSRRSEVPASGHIFCPLVSEMGLIAMQKVEGSNPFSRFARNLALGRDFVVSGGAKGKWNHPLLSPLFWAPVPEMTPMRADSADFARFRLALRQRRSYGRRAKAPRGRHRSRDFDARRTVLAVAPPGRH
jgi:hypothetical protein